MGRDLSGATGLVLFVGAFASTFGLNIARVSVATRRRRAGA
jgi:hypothetical protein